MRGTLRKAMILGLAVQLVWCAVSLASETHRGQGLVMEMDTKTQTLVVHEKLFRYDQNTKITDLKGASIGINKITTKTRVSIEWVEGKPGGPRLIKSISIVPRRVDKKVKVSRPSSS
jgi:hypothetical protein